MLDVKFTSNVNGVMEEIADVGMLTLPLFSRLYRYTDKGT